MGFLWTFLPLFMIGISGCDNTSLEEPPPQFEKAQSERISAHTTGIVSKETSIRVRFVEPVFEQDGIKQALQISPFSFVPDIPGHAAWTSTQELHYYPDAPLQPGKVYQVAFEPHKVNSAWEDPPFSFTFQVSEPAYWLFFTGLEAEGQDPSHQRYLGTLRTADVQDKADIEQMIQVAYGQDTLEVDWTHDENRITHTFTIRHIPRRDNASDLTIQFNGEPIGIEKSEEKTVSIPGLNDFDLLSSRAVLQGEKYIELRFSDPLLPNQNLNGLITADGKSDLRFAIEGSIVRIYSTSGWHSDTDVHIRAIRNLYDFQLTEEQTVPISFSPPKPEVRFASKGVIVPTTEGLTVPIEVINVSGVEVEALRVYESNVPQFLQINAIDSNKHLQRVGKVVWKAHIPIEMTPDRVNRWVRLGLDVSPLIEADPNGLYHLKMRFTQHDIVYPCSSTPPEPSIHPVVDDWEQGQSSPSFWDNMEEQGVSYWEARQHRDDPCHIGYYAKYYDHDIVATKNIMISDLGLMAKKGEDGSLLVFATDIQTTEPVQGAEVKILDYQLQEIASEHTDSEGAARFHPSTKPFAITAEAKGQVSWLKLDKGSALAMGHFDVSGASVPDGLKGFFYGERGVWRPGDPIHLTFVLEDQSGTLPDDHPIHFEWVNPQGQRIERRTINHSVNGFYDLTTSTVADAPTGNYLARVRVGGATFTHTLRVETIMPNRLKIDLDFGTDMIQAPDFLVDATLGSRWLHGAIAGGLKTKIEYTLVSQRTKFPKFSDYVFDDPTQRFSGQTEALFEGQLNQQGEVGVRELLKVGGVAPGMLKARFLTRVFEPSGAFSVDQFTMPVSPHKRYIGIKTPKGDAKRSMLLTDTKHPIHIVAVDGEGNLSGDGEVELRLYKVNWRWWWEKGDDNLADYDSSSSHTPLQTGTVELKDGVGTWEIEVKYPSWGRYLITASDTLGEHRSAKVMYIDWPGWAGRAQKDQPDGASVLSVTAEKDKVAVGEDMTISFPSAQGGGRALVSIESGTQVLDTQWVIPSGDSTKITFTATPEMAPNVFANVTVLQPHLVSGNDLPIRLYGIVPIEVYDPKTKLHPLVKTEAEFEPDSTTEISVSEADGLPMTYTLSVVDEGLLGLTRFTTPNPWNWFYRREALGVRSWDVFSDVAGAYGGSLEGLLAIGGDGENEEVPVAKANRFPPVVRHLGPFSLAAGEMQTHTVDIPQYMGEVRVMVVAGQDGAYGATEQSVFVRKPIVVLATLPRVLGPEEEVRLPVSVFSLKEEPTTVILSLELEGPLTGIDTDPRTLSFDKPSDQIASFQLKVGSEIGVAKIRVKAESDKEVAEHAIEIDIRHPGSEITKAVTATVNGGDDWQADLNPVGISGSNGAILEVSRVPPMGLGQHLNRLIGYPHGCVEQTTSKAFPQVYLTHLMDLRPSQTTKVEEHVKAAIKKMVRFQTSTGGFGYWPGASVSHDWASSYAGHFLMEAERAGYVLPKDLRGNWIAYQQRVAHSWYYDGKRSDLEQSYRLYTLALAGAPQLGAMNRLREVTLSTQAQWRLAAAYVLAGQPEAAEALVSDQSMEIASYTELSGTFGSKIRDEAMILETLVLMEDSRALDLALAISKALQERPNLSTQSIAYSLVALARFANAGGDDNAMDFTWTLDGKSAQVSSDRAIVQIPMDIHESMPSPFTLENKSAHTAFVQVLLSGLPPIGEETASNHQLAIGVTYDQPSGRVVNETQLTHGEDFRATVTITNQEKRQLSELALTHIVPSGWEIHDTASGTGDGYDYRDVRDDRVYTYFDLGPKETRTFTIPLNAAYRGRYYLPPIDVEAMYDSRIHARTAGRWVEVVAPGAN